MRIGRYNVQTLEGGRLGLDGGAMFGIVPKPLWSRAIQPDEKNRIPLAMRCLLIEGEGRLILVDTGLGEKEDAKFRDIYAVDQEQSSLRRSLTAAGFVPEEITDVVLTHLHFDHCGGATRYTGEEERLELVFPNATHHVQESHWQWATESPREQASFLARNLDPISDSGQLSLVRGDAELFPGIDTLVVDGHTHGQQLLTVRGGGNTLFYAADLLPTSAHVSPLWIMSYDIEPLKTLEEKQRLLRRAVDEDWIVVFEHDVNVGAARIQEDGQTFKVMDAVDSLSSST
ncbi:MBL fold metallo-hydrolase [soil metagenome]